MKKMNKINLPIIRNTPETSRSKEYGPVLKDINGTTLYGFAFLKQPC